MCDRLSTTKEHVPPRCLFPEAKDVGIECRKQLITVPSCDVHNIRKSADDEFLLISLAGIIGNNSIGYAHKFTKVNRSIHRSSFRVLDEALKNQKVELLELGPNKFIDVIWGTPDYARLFGCFDHIARGLHFHEFGKRFVGSTKPLIGYTCETESNPLEFKRLIKDKVTAELSGKQRIGANPDIFTYQFTDPDQFGLFLVHLQFYGGMDVYVGFIPESTEPPPNLAAELIRLGIQTTISDGENTYTFNKPNE
jgi:hypothetical protein